MVHPVVASYFDFVPSGTNKVAGEGETTILGFSSLHELMENVLSSMTNGDWMWETTVVSEVQLRKAF